MPMTSGFVLPELDPPEAPPHAAVTARATAAIASETLWDATLTTTPLSSGKRQATIRGRLQLDMQSVASTYSLEPGHVNAPGRRRPRRRGRRGRPRRDRDPPPSPDRP